MTQRFTIHGSDALEQHLAGVCDAIRDCIQDVVPARLLEGVALGGGYGRGEGGVLRTSEGDKPYNDLEFFVFIRGQTNVNEARFGKSLHALGERLSPIAGIEVEFKILSIAKLMRSAPSMFYYDLVAGHRWVIGDDSLFEDCAHHRDASIIPLHEATRLLMNRCTGLLYAKERLMREEFTSDDTDFVSRNIAKAELAFGDVLLVAQRAYHWSCLERGHRVKCLDVDLPEAPQLRRFHAEGVQFKLHPVRSVESRESLMARHTKVNQTARALWLWLEARRLKRTFESPKAYSLSEEVKCPEHSIWKNLALNMRVFGSWQLFSKASTRYPRERLLRALPLLLWGMTSPSEEAMVAECLHCNATNLHTSVEAFHNLWQRFN